MSDLDNQLERLFSAARNAKAPAEIPLPASLENRVLREWRQTRETTGASPLEGLYRQAAIWSVGLACLALFSVLHDWAGLRALNDWHGIGLRMANEELNQWQYVALREGSFESEGRVP
jgi:hypothetical protein